MDYRDLGNTTLEGDLRALDPGLEGPGEQRSDVLGLTVWFDAAGRFHRPEEDGPAVVRDDGTEEYWRHGHVSRLAGPAVLRPNPREIIRVEPTIDGYAAHDGAGSPRREIARYRVRSSASMAHRIAEYWVDDLRHRDEGPAVVHADGIVEYWRHGRRHRSDGPAIEYPRPYGKWAAGPDEYWVDGVLHCADGAAQRRFTVPGATPSTLGKYALEGNSLTYDKWRVLRHYRAGTDRPHLDPRNTYAWDEVVAVGAVDTTCEVIDPVALELALALHRNP